MSCHRWTWGSSLKLSPTSCLKLSVWRWLGSLALPKGCTRLREEGCDLLEVTILDETPPGSWTPVVEMEHQNLYLRGHLRRVHHYSGGCGKVDDVVTTWGSQCCGYRCQRRWSNKADRQSPWLLRRRWVSQHMHLSHFFLWGRWQQDWLCDGGLWPQMY